MPAGSSTLPDLMQAGHRRGRLASTEPSEEAGMPTFGIQGIPSGETR